MKYLEFYQAYKRTKPQRIIAAAKELQGNFDYIAKKDAILYLTDLFPCLSIRDRIKAWELVYNK